MIQVSAVVTDKFGQPVVVPTMYMEILDSAGKEYWPLSPIARNVSSFAKLISTNEFKHNTRYIVRVGINRKLSPQGYEFFKTKNRKIIPAFIPLVFAPLVLVPRLDLDPELDLIPRLDLIPEEAKKPIFLTYKTELDARVCPICEPNEGLVFAVDDPKLIRIGPPELGGETHFGCRCHYDMEVALNAALAKVQRIIDAGRAAMVVHAVQKHKELMVIN